jgi:alpha,alpha-trehalase
MPATAYTSVLAHIDAYWQRIIRRNPNDHETLIGMPHPYLVPSDGMMFQEFYYWDSYFMSMGVIGTPHEHLIVDTARNFAYLIERFGLIPNGSRYYFLSRSQPPFSMAQLRLAHAYGGGDVLVRELLPHFVREHENVWLGERQPHYRQVYRGLSRYYDINFLDILASCECGWDHSTRCDDRWLAHLPVDLNAILYEREVDIAWAYALLGDASAAQSWRARAGARQATMQDLMWDEERGFFFDYDYHAKTINPHPSLAGFFPLWAGLATEAQAARVVRDWLPAFEFTGGLATTLTIEAGKQWAFPNGWAPLQWIVNAGLERYGFTDDARRLRRKWCDMVATVFDETGACWEKYNVVDPYQRGEGGLYGQVTGFGWTNAVFKDFARRLD